MEHLLSRGLKMNHLRLAAALLEEGKLSDAAARLHIAQPAASRLASETQNIIGAPLFIRAGRGIELTPEGKSFAIRAQRIMHEIDAADREVQEVGSGMSGQVNLGSVTGPAIEYVLPIIRQARISFPRIQIAVEVTTSDQLCELLRNGRLDFALARMPQNDPAAQFDYTPAADESVSLIVRSEHPLSRRPAPLSIRELTDFDWVLPPPGAILRQTVDSIFRSQGITPPRQVLNTSSFLLTLATVGQTNAVAAIASSVAKTFEARGNIRILEIDTKFAVEEFGFVTRTGGRLSPSAETIKNLVSEAIRQPLRGEDAIR